MGPNNSYLYLKTHATGPVPDGLAADTLRGLIHQQEEQLKGLDDEIAQQRALPHALEAQRGRAELAKLRDHHRALLAPIQKLPPEILGEVFIQSLLASWHGRTRRERTLDVRPSLLQVCQQWKRTALGTPGLWTMLRFDLARLGPYSRVQMCLDNSGGLPIKVKMGDPDYEGTAEMRLLLENFHRVEEISGWGFPLMLEILDRELVLPTPLLKVVNVIWNSPKMEPCSEAERLRLQNIIQAPPIENLCLTSCPQLLSIFCQNPGKLQNLRVDGGCHHRYTSELLDVLPSLSSLQSLDLRLPQHPVSVIRDARITLPHLSSMSIAGHPDDIGGQLAALDVPSLDSFTLHHYLSDRPIPWIPIQSFLQGDPPPLQYLTVTHIFLEHGFMDLISRLSHLEHLKLDMCTGMDEHFGAFILDPHISHDNMVCPKLATLSVYSTELPGAVLVKVVQSCVQLSGVTWENRCLQSVEASGCWSQEDHHVALEQIREACGGRLALNSNLCGPW